MIEDEKGLVQCDTFKKMFFTFFKGERSAYQVYEMLVPIVTCFYDEQTDTMLDPEDSRATDATMQVSI
jgi:hypothetical protein